MHDEAIFSPSPDSTLSTDSRFVRYDCAPGRRSCRHKAATRGADPHGTGLH
jgi:hypothetical protein